MLVLNAGAMQRSTAEEMPLSAARSLMELNFCAVIEHARAALPALRLSRGQIAVTSSFAGKIGTPVLAVYSATKHALQGYFGALRGEVPEVDITMLCPEPVASEIAQAAGVQEDNRSCLLLTDGGDVSRGSCCIPRPSFVCDKKYYQGGTRPAGAA